MAYATTDELKAYLSTVGSSHDTLLGDCLSRASQYIDLLTDRKWTADEDTTKSFDARECVEEHGQYLFFNEDLCDITEVLNGDGEIIDPSDYWTDPKNETPWFGLKLKPSSGLAWANGDDDSLIQITGKWAVMEEPDDALIQLTIRLAAYLYRQRETSIDLDRAVIGASGIVLAQTLPSDIMDIIMARRRVV